MVFARPPDNQGEPFGRPIRKSGKEGIEFTKKNKLLSNNAQPCCCLCPSRRRPQAWLRSNLFAERRTVAVKIGSGLPKFPNDCLFSLSSLHHPWFAWNLVSGRKGFLSTQNAL